MVEFANALPDLARFCLLVGVGLRRRGELGASVIEVLTCEELADPRVEAGDDAVLPDVDGRRMVTMVGGVIAVDLAAVVGPVVVPGAFHAATTPTTGESTSEHVLASFLRSAGVATLVAPEPGLCGLPLLSCDQSLVAGFLGPDPFGGIVPSHPGLVAKTDIVDVDEDLVAALLVPHLVAGVARVLEDRPHRGEPPLGAVGEPMTVATGVGGGRGEDAVGGEAVGDRAKTAAAEELAKDSANHRSRSRIRFELPGSEPGGGFGWVGVRSGVGELVAVRWPAPEEPAFHRSLGGHGRADSGLDPVALAFAHPAVEAHDDLVGVGAGVDGAAHLWDPQLYRVVDEHREGEPELVAVERPLRLPDDNGIECTGRVAERLEELRRFRSP